jgi:hypothetical protein
MTMSLIILEIPDISFSILICDCAFAYLHAIYKVTCELALVFVRVDALSMLCIIFKCSFISLCEEILNTASAAVAVCSASILAVRFIAVATTF